MVASTPSLSPMVEKIPEVECLTTSDEDRYRDHVLQSSSDQLSPLCKTEALRLKLYWCLPPRTPSDSDDQSGHSESTRATDLTSVFSDGQSLHSIQTSVRNSSSSFVSTTSSLSSFYDQARDAKKKSFGRIRELSVLRFYKTSSRVNLANGCSHCPQDVASQRRAVYELSCGHKWCLQALRARLIRWDLHTVDFCCGQPVPDHLIRLVLRPDELTLYQERLELFNAKAGIAVLPETELLRQEQQSMRERFDEWSDGILSHLQQQHDEMRSVLDKSHLSTVDNMLARHAEALSVAEDKQVKAEADLRDLQAREQQDHTTALLYMEAYCSGVLRSGEQHNRSVSEQDLLELHKTKAQQAGLQQKHDSSINILRGEQQRRIKIRVQRQDNEVQALEGQHRKEELALEQEYRRAGDACRAEIARRRQQLESRWDAELAVCLRSLREALPGP